MNLALIHSLNSNHDNIYIYIHIYRVKFRSLLNYANETNNAKVRHMGREEDN